MADSVENILHLWSPLLWASHIPSNQTSNGHKMILRDPIMLPTFGAREQAYVLQY